VSHAQEKVKLTYELENSDLGENIWKVKGKIINESNQDIFFYSESCNQLDYLLSTNTENSSIYVFFHCNATFPTKNLLQTNAVFEFTTHVQLMPNQNNVGLNLEFIELYKNLEVNDQRHIQNYDQSKDVKQITIIQGPIITIN
jgi:hypothetical protein